MKRILAVLLAVFLLLSVGCSTTKNVKAEETAAPKEETVKEETVKEDAANVIADNQDVLYNVCVTDENGPVAGVIIQFCSWTSCQMGKTNAEGLAGFTMPAGEIYDIHVLKAPEGYEKDDTVYHTEDGKSDVQIQLKKK